MRAWLAVALLVAGPAPVAAQCLLARPGSPYDFRAGSTTLFATDFRSDPLGEFPEGLEFLQGAMEVARWRGQPALKAASASALAIPLAGPLPESFSVEIGVVNRNTKQVGAATVKVYGGRAFLSDFDVGAARAEYGPVGWRIIGGGAQAEAQFDSDDADACIGQEVIVRLQVDGDRVRLFADERRLASVPRASFRRAGGLVVALEGRDDGDNAVYLTRIRVTGSEPAVVATVPAPGTPTPVPPAATTTPTRAGGPPPAGDRARDLVPVDSTPTVLVPPTAVRVQPMHYQGLLRVSWDPVPGAVGYTLLRRLADGSLVGANPLTQPVYDASRTGGLTMELEQGAVGISVVADYGNGRVSPPSPVVAAEVPRHYGRYRVWVLGFRVIRETLDNPLELDGKRDEVYLRAAVVERGPDGQNVGVVTELQTRVHGDINAPAWRSPTSPQRRIQAGSASADGGLMTGDAFPVTAPWQLRPVAPAPESFPLLLWEGDLMQGLNSVQAAFQLWETDDLPNAPATNLGSYSPEAAALDVARPAAQRLSVASAMRLLTRQFTGDRTARGHLLMISEPGLADLAPWTLEQAPPAPRLPMMRKAMAPLDSLADRITDLEREVGLDLVPVITQAGQEVLGFLRAQEQRLQLALNVRDRPLGIRLGPQGQIYAVPAVLTLTAENVETEALRGNGPAGLGVGVYEFRFADQDPAPPISPLGGRGIYSVYLRVERVR